MESESVLMTGARHHLFDTAFGVAGIAWGERGITRFQLPASDRRAVERRIGALGEPSDPPPPIAGAIAEAQRYFAGAREDFTATPLDLSGVDPFRRQIYDVLRTIGYGETLTYGELAARIGAPGGAQAVGQAMGSNPIPLIIPCHRVLAAGGKIGGFSAPGGADTKERMLALEGVYINNQPRLL